MPLRQLYSYTRASCAVREAVDSGRIAPSRYVSYLGILEDKEGGKYRPEYK